MAKYTVTSVCWLWSLHTYRSHRLGSHITSTSGTSTEILNGTGRTFALILSFHEQKTDGLIRLSINSILHNAPNASRMGKTYTDFSQHSKGMFKKSAPVEEIKPLPKTKTLGGDDALSFFGLNAPEPPTGASLRLKPMCGLYVPIPPVSFPKQREPY